MDPKHHGPAQREGAPSEHLLLADPFPRARVIAHHLHNSFIQAVHRLRPFAGDSMADRQSGQEAVKQENQGARDFPVP